MIWRFADGTEVELGGIVRGAAPLARRLRAEVDDVRAGRGPLVYRVAPILDPLDLDDAELVSSWVLSRARFLEVAVVEAPVVGTPGPDKEPPEGVVY